VITCRAAGCPNLPAQNKTLCHGHRSQQRYGKPFSVLAPAKKYMSSWERQKLQGLHKEGWSCADIARELGYTRQAVSNALRKKMQKLPGERLDDDSPRDDLTPYPGVERCPRCLLALPHYDCIPLNTRELASSRPGTRA
jgi:hypothetical protein